MDIRNVQRTGNMFYVYLPTKWVKLHHIAAKSKVSVNQNVDGSLTFFAEIKEKKPKPLHIKLATDNQNVIHKVIVSCYINPTSSFQIDLAKKLDSVKILDQKKLMSLELVELEGNHVLCDSMVIVSDPASMLLTMVRKVKNLITSMIHSYDYELVLRYEEEIDRSKILLEKSVITSLVTMDPGKLKMIDLHYIALIGKNIERMVDHLISLKKFKPGFLEQLLQRIADLQRILHEVGTDSASSLNYDEVITFLEQVDALEDIKVKDVATYDMRRAVRALQDISEVVIDWTITRKIGK